MCSGRLPHALRYATTGPGVASTVTVPIMHAPLAIIPSEWMISQCYDLQGNGYISLLSCAVPKKGVRMSYLLRLSLELHKKLKALAERNHRSLNAEILYRLERSVRTDERREQRDR